MKEIFHNILTLLQAVSDISNGQILEPCLENDDGLRMWKHVTRLPGKEKGEFYIILPSDDQAIDLSRGFNLNSEYCIVDCFDRFSEDERTISATSFFKDYLFESSRYRAKFTAEKDEIDRRSSNIVDIDRFYVGRTVSFYNNEDEKVFQSSGHEKLEGALSKWKADAKKPLLLIGERGMGKSWAVLNFCKQHLQNHYESPWENPLPIYIDLRILSENTPPISTLTELLLYHLTNLYGIGIFGDHFTLLALLRTGRIILVLDGLDEMSKEVSHEVATKNLWQVFNLCSNTQKYILTSRRSFFSSEMELNEHFAYRRYFTQQQKSQADERVYNVEERKVRQDINVWRLDNLADASKKSLFGKLGSCSEYLKRGKSKLTKLSKYRADTIEHEVYHLCNTPAYVLPLLRLLGSKVERPLVEIFEICVDEVVIEFNIEHERGIDSYRTIDNSKSGKPIKINIFEAEQKNEILRKLSWYMVTRGISRFDVKEFSKFILDIEGNSYDIILHDLQTQTVITLDKEEGKYSFLSESIFGFYLASYLFLLLTSEHEKEVTKGIQSIGRHDFNDSGVWTKAKIFLKAKLTDLGNGQGSENAKLKAIEKTALNAFVKDKPYSPWLKYLSSNLNALGIEVSQRVLKQRDFWNLEPISSHLNDTDKKLVLIPGRSLPVKEKIDPFFLGISEVTNRDYSQFLKSKAPAGSENSDDWLGRFWKRSQSFNLNLRKKNPYSSLINYYHLIYWKNDEIPKGYEDHPVVWVSWFAAAKYCNWLSRTEKLDPYYKFDLTDRKSPTVTRITDSYGYRLPNEIEWRHAASEGNLKKHSLLELLDPEEIESLERKLHRSSESTSPIRSENPNRYGVYGLMGNVREWVDDPEKTKVSQYDNQVVKGMGWLLGREGLKFRHSVPLIAQNTNLDLGFRIARSLSKDELVKVTKAYSNS
jgi:formylglycine-generating enzyme required for sulfatase activity